MYGWDFEFSIIIGIIALTYFVIAGIVGIIREVIR